MTGWRIGYAVGPADIIKAATLVQDHSTSGPNSFTQKAAITALRGDEKAITDMVAEFDKRRRYIVERLNNIDGITCMLPKGAFYVFPNVSALYGRDICGQTTANSVDLSNLILDKARTALFPVNASVLIITSGYHTQHPWKISGKAWTGWKNSCLKVFHTKANFYSAPSGFTF